ncbi:Toll/interleukin-1 receptor homology (TIR) domain superfamily [Arabidopsis thaliana x Arabidopsis arenosa]|nr:Toll/interleukin-1 receptor homology (TIR) domain superfamily [Arabidopsis thaliana x Arabidopsis arenosa]
MIKEEQYKAGLEGSIPVLVQSLNWLAIAEEIDDLYLGDAEVWRRASVENEGPLGGDFPIVTSDGHNILDVIFTTPIRSLADLATSLDKIDGVVDHGLIIKTRCTVVIAEETVVRSVTLQTSALEGGVRTYGQTLQKIFRFRKRNKNISSSLSSSSPPSSLSQNWLHPVFLSFRGEDVRKGLLSHIQKEFQRNGITPFIDNEMKRGGSIGPELLQAIRGSKIAIHLAFEELWFFEVDFDEFVGIEAHTTEITSLLQLDLEEVRMIGIWGPAGVAQERLKDKKVLLVLDDVDGLVQLDAMAKDVQWFGLGSRIIVVTQDLKLLKAHGIKYIYKVDFPTSDEALEIFCMYAFGEKSPKVGFEQIARTVTTLAGKLPLGLRVMGSYLRRMSKQEWAKSIPRLRTSLDDDIESVLKFSYNSLAEQEKDLFFTYLFFSEGKGLRHWKYFLQRSLDIVRKQSIHKPGNVSSWLILKIFVKYSTDDTVPELL